MVARQIRGDLAISASSNAVVTEPCRATVPTLVTDHVRLAAMSAAGLYFLLRGESIGNSSLNANIAANIQRLLVIAVLMPLWASYLVKAYAWRGMLSENGLVSWLAAGPAPPESTR